MTAPKDPACDAYRTLINDDLDGLLAGQDRVDLEHHLTRCDACRQEAADLAQIRRVAQALPPRRPRADAWQQIAARLSQELPARPLSRRSPWGSSRVFLAAAAVLLAAVASTVWLVRQPVPAEPAPQAAAAAPAPAHPGDENPVRSIDEELRAAELHYERAIAGLEQIAKSEQASLDPAVAATLQKNLGVIDQAIKESRNAIQSQPASQLAQDSLFEALRRKVALLEDTVSLINTMRKGDEAGTARVIRDMSKS
jgi:anti-sigma factor RsiW